MQKIPSQKTPLRFVLNNFKGVDFTSKELSQQRSPNAYNIINNNGYIESRDGYKVLNTIGTNINGVWNFDTEDGDIFIIHSGTKLYQSNNTFSEFVEVLSGMTDSISSAVYLKGYLTIFDGTRAVIYGKFDSDYEAKFLDTCGYIPTTKIQMLPAGGGKAYEEVNMCSKYRINTFLGTADDTEYHLNEQGLNNDTVYVSKLTNEGWVDLIENTDFTVNRTDGIVTFPTAPGETPLNQEDNVKIRYAKDNTEYFNIINKANLVTEYGYNGNNNRLFINGFYPNYVYYSYQDDPFYFPDTNYLKAGQQKIINFIKTNDGRLGIQKRLSDTEFTIYWIQGVIYNGEERFNIVEGVKNLGCISKYANDNLLNDPLTLTEQGIYSVVGAENGEKYAVQRDYYVNAKLMQESNLENAYGIVCNGRYYLSINNHIYIADSRFKTYNQQAKSSDSYQYEWYYWKDIPARVLFSFNNALYFGTNDGKICNFSNGNKDIDTPVESYFSTTLLDLGTSSLTKTIKRITLITNNNFNSNIELGYKLDDGTYDIIEINSNASEFPKIVQEKEKITKFMYIKFIFKNTKNYKMSFKELNVEYKISGKYRG